MSITYDPPRKRVCGALKSATERRKDRSVPLSAIWLLRAKLARLEEGSAPRRYRGRSGGFELDVDDLDLLGEETKRGPKRARLRRELRLLLSLPVRRDSLFLRNSAMLTGALGIGTVDAEIFALLVHARLDAEIEEVIGPMLRTDPPHLAELIAKILDLEPEVVLAAIRRGSPLREAQLIASGGRIEDSFGSTIGVPARVCDALSQQHDSAESLLATFCRRAPDPLLALVDYPHATALVEAACAVLNGALDQHATGVNILISGDPGTGKTQLARLLAHLCKAYAAEIPGEDNDGDPIDGNARLACYGLAQRTLAKCERAAIIFDEAEDSFGSARFSFMSFLSDERPTSGKAWKTRLLEQNAKPTIWLCNSIAGFDPAYLRRFDLVLELRKPGPDVRRRMLQAQLAGLPVSEAWIERTSLDDRLAPAFVERAARALKLTGHATQEAAEKFLAGALAGLLDTQGARSASVPIRPAKYDLSYVNATMDLATIVRGLDKRRRGTLCLYGRSGTGKSDFVRDLAVTLGLPLISRRASDLLGMYVGQTERNIADMFRHAREAMGILLLDEADSFLRDRSGATRPWEVSQVNELLVQMEAHEGIFVCTTNLKDTLDEASLRRFDLKVRFDAPTADQVWRLFLATLGPDAARAVEGDQRMRAALGRFAGLTPGDFATAVRRAGVLDQAIDGATLLGALEDEWKAKPEVARRKVGFGRDA